MFLEIKKPANAVIRLVGLWPRSTGKLWSHSSDLIGAEQEKASIGGLAHSRSSVEMGKMFLHIFALLWPKCL